MAQTFETSEAPHITIKRCSADLEIAGNSERRVVVVGDEDDVHVERQGESFAITADDDCDIHCPRGTSITIQQVSGDLQVQGIGGPLAIQSVSGDAELRDVGPATLQSVSGDLEARGVDGELRIQSASGDAELRDVKGLAALESVSGDLAARALHGGALVKNVSGDVSLNTALAENASYQIEARGDISAKIEVGEGGARFTLEASDLHCRLPLQFTERTSRRVVGVLGEGKSELILKARGDLAISESGETWGPVFETEFESAMETWAHQFEAQMADMERKLEERLAHIPFVDGERVAKRAQEAAERARRQAERTAERARARAERAREHAEHDRRKHDKHGFGFRMQWSPPSAPKGPPSAPKPPKPPAEPISDTERMTILKLVADKKISAEEAQKLLAALEGEA